MTSNDVNKYELRKQIKEFYKLAGIRPPIITHVNDNVAAVFSQMVYEAKSCSKKMAFVPKPTREITIMWVIKYIVSIVRSVSSDDVSDIKCLRLVILHYKTPLEHASQGL